MDREQSQSISKEKSSLLIGLLALLWLILSAYSLWVIGQASDLRQEFERGLEWKQSLQQTRLALRKASASGSDRDWPRPYLLQLRYLAGDSPSWIDAPDLSIAWKDLEMALADWPNAAIQNEDPDALWRISERSLEALGQLETSVGEGLIQLQKQRENPWNKLLWLLLAALCLAALNLGFFLTARQESLFLAAAHRDALEWSSHDALTGVWNRTTILRLLGLELARARRQGVPVGLILADLDRFAEINELIGQEQGDFILEQIAKRMHSMVRPYDTLGRFGGDSFLLFLPACDESGTVAVAERMREMVNLREVEYAHGHLLVHMSLACMTVPHSESLNIDLLIRHLREGIDRARQGGPGRLHRASADY